VKLPTTNITPVFFILLLSLPLYFGLGAVHLFDWDEINFAECAREMIVSGQYLSPMIKFEPFWEKPPLFFWLQAASMHMFGITEFAARLPNALFGTATLLLLYFAGRHIAGNRMGILWALLYISSILPFLYFKPGIIDPVFNFFIFVSYFIALTALHKKRALYFFVIAGLINGLAILTKGPVGFAIPLLSLLVTSLMYKKKWVLPLFTFCVSSLFVSVLWFSAWIAVNGWSLFNDFIIYQAQLFTQPVAGHKGFFLYHFIVVFMGCFPASVFALPMLFRKKNNLWLSGMQVLFWVVMILFTLVSTKILHYTSLAYFPVSFFAAQYFTEVFTQHKRKRIVLAIYLALGALWSLALLTLALFPMYKDILQQYVNDPVAAANIAASQWKFEVIHVLPFLFFVCAIAAGFYYLQKHKTLHFIICHFVGFAAALCIIQSMLLPKIENLTQGPFIDEIKLLQEQGIAVYTSGMKSYAPYYYGRITPDYSANFSTGDKKICIATKISKPAPANIPETVTFYTRGGYHFYIFKPGQ